jgi:DNA-binding response OmpR family regulator
LSAVEDGAAMSVLLERRSDDSARPSPKGVIFRLTLSGQYGGGMAWRWGCETFVAHPAQRTSGRYGSSAVPSNVMSAVLIAEPEPGVRGFLERHLAQDGFDVFGTDDRAAALELVMRARPDLVLLGDPAALEAFPGVPVIVIGGEKSDAVDRVRAFARGCDDFVARPFVYDELVARINAVLRRVRPAPPACLVAGPIAIEHVTRRVSVDDVRVDLAVKEYELLTKLASEPQRVFTKEELLREVWGFRSLGRTRTLDSHASRLRRKLQAVAPGPFVINVWRVGYRLMD